MNINTRITEFYNSAAEIVCNSICSSCDKKCSHKFNAMVMGNNGISDITALFTTMLDDISLEIIGSRGDREQSYTEYYRDTPATRFSKEITDIKRSVKNITKKCDTTNSSHNTISDIIRKGLKVRIDRKRIAELLYYKANHRFYDEEVEQAYTEIVAQATSGRNGLLSKATYSKLRKLTEEIMTSAADEVYRSIYDKPAIQDKYKPSLERFNEGLGEDTPFFAKCTIETPTQAILWYQNSEYWEKAITQIREKQYITWKKCFENYYSDNDYEVEAISKNTYLDYVTKHIPKLIGISDTLKNFLNRENYNGAYVAKDLGYLVNQSVNKCACLFRKRGKSKEYHSRFELVNSIQDMDDLCELMHVYMQVVAARLSRYEYEKLTSIESADDDENKELSIISASMPILKI